jgi:hypothetical protein
VLAVEDADGSKVVTVAPVTHTPPRHPQSALEIPLATKERLGLDGARSWIVAADLNRFVWPGVDLRPTRRGTTTYSYGMLPAALFRQLRDQIVSLGRTGKASVTPRSE